LLAHLAACDLVEIELSGVGCHGTFPHKDVGPIATGAALVNNLAMMMTRENQHQDRP